MFVHDYLELLQKAENKDDLALIAEKMASGELQYAFPYQLKSLIMEYSKVILKIIEKTQTSSSVTSIGIS